MPDMPMPPQAPSGGAPQDSKPTQDSGSAADLVSGINSSLMKLMDLVGGASGISPEEKQELGQIIQSYQSFVDKLGQPAGQKQAPPQGPPQAQGPASMEAGSNPNARPM